MKRNTSTLPPLTPDLHRIQEIKVVPDTHAEAIIFELYLREKALRQAAQTEVRRLTTLAHHFKTAKKISRTSRQLKPSHNPAPKERQ